MYIFEVQVIEEKEKWSSHLDLTRQFIIKQLPWDNRRGIAEVLGSHPIEANWIFEVSIRNCELLNLSRYWMRGSILPFVKKK